MGGGYRGWLCYFPIVLVLFLFGFQIIRTVKRQETVYLFVTHTCNVSTNDFEYFCILNGAVISISGWILMPTFPVPSNHVVMLYFLLSPASPRGPMLYVLSVAYNILWFLSWTADGTDSSINEPKTIVKSCSFRLLCSRIVLQEMRRQDCMVPHNNSIFLGIVNIIL